MSSKTFTVTCYKNLALRMSDSWILTFILQNLSERRAWNYLPLWTQIAYNNSIILVNPSFIFQRKCVKLALYNTFTPKKDTRILKTTIHQFLTSLLSRLIRNQFYMLFCSAKFYFAKFFKKCVRNFRHNGFAVFYLKGALSWTRRWGVGSLKICELIWE